MSTRLRGAALSAALTCIATAVRADEALPSPLPLGDLIGAVRRRNSVVLGKREGARGAAQRPRAEGLPDDPTVMLEWWQQPFSFSSVPIMLTVRQTLPWVGTLRRRRQLSEREARIAGDEADVVTRQAVADAKRAYFDLLLAEQTLEVNARVRALDQHLVEVTDALYRVGKSVQSDLFKAQSELLTVENDRLDVERARDDARARINALVDLPVGGPVGPTATPARIVILPPERDLVERALAQRPELRRAQDELAAADLRVQLAGRTRLPELAVWAGAMVNLGAPASSSTITVGVSSTLPIFSSVRRRPVVGAAEADLSAARRALDAARRDAELAVHAALLRIETAERHVHLHVDKLIPLADLTLASAEASYQAGRADFPSLLDAARMVRDHHLDHFKFLVEYRRRIADLEQIVGELDLDGATP